MDLSEPIDPCDKIAPNPTLLVSELSIKSFVKSGYANTGSLLKISFIVSKASINSDVWMTLTFFGYVILEKFFMNFL